MGTQLKRVRRKRRATSAPAGWKQLFTARGGVYLACVAIGFVVGFLILNSAPRAYGTWRESRLQKRAAASLEKQDLDGATQAAQQMLQIRRDSLAAFQILAETTEKQNRPETVAWRSQIARALPQNLDAQLNLASAALRFGQLDVARRALENVATQDRDKPAYHVVAGWLARAQGNDADVEQHFAAAVEKEPANDLYQFNLAVLQIRSSEETKYFDARETLERLSKVQGYRVGSLRALLGDAVERDDLQRADPLAQELQMAQRVTFQDLLLCLQLYRKVDEKKFTALLEKVKPVAARDGADLAALMDWMNRNDLAAEVLKWNDKLPPEVTTVPPPAIAIAEAFTDVKNWSRLKRWTRGGSWGDAEFQRLAYQAYAARQGRQSAADAEYDSLWHAAERAAADQPEREATLARLATRWGLTVEAKQLWKRVAKHAPLRREALDALFRIFRADNDLPELLQVARQLHESSPREPSLTSSYARLALLVSPSTDEARRLAKEAFDAAPKDVNCAITYAFSLYSAGRTADGLEILRRLPADAFDDPHAAVYVAVLYVDENQLELAKPYLAAAQKGALFPEEKKLLEEATSRASLLTVAPPAQPTPPSALAKPILPPVPWLPTPVPSPTEPIPVGP
ncbi:MAG: tetratricopeptide repeat protein [Chthoniobacterales bacterium]